jgi:hypothetical protein
MICRIHEFGPRSLFRARVRHAVERVQNVSKTRVELSGLVETPVDVVVPLTHYASSACRQKSRAITNLKKLS